MKSTSAKIPKVTPTAVFEVSGTATVVESEVVVGVLKERKN